MTLDDLNSLGVGGAYEVLERCCGARAWVEALVARRPFPSVEDAYRIADDVWAGMGRNDIMEAFRHHPRIGDVEGLRTKFASTATWACGEQAGAVAAEESTLQALAQGNMDYEARFGHIFIVCATGKSAAEMLAILGARMPNEPDAELLVAAEQQRLITRIRLEKLFS